MNSKTAASVFISFILVFAIPLLPVIISGNWFWTDAWILSGVYIFGFIASRLLVYFKNPELLTERLNAASQEGAEKWDRPLLAHLALGSILFFIMPGIEARLDILVEVPLVFKSISVILIIVGYFVSAWALVENRFFTAVVRLQKDRGHTVVTTGPYRFVRHPGYAGGLLTYPAAAVLLGSIWMLVPVLYMLLVLVVRTEKEDNMLQAKLAGYREYVGNVRYRLIPGVW